MDPKQIQQSGSVRRRRDRGANLVEHALLISLIALVAIPSMRSVGKNVDCALSTATNNLKAASTPNLPFVVTVPSSCPGGAASGGGGSSSSSQG